MRRSWLRTLGVSLAVCLAAGLQLIPSAGQDVGHEYEKREFENTSFAGASFRWCDLTQVHVRDCKLGAWRVESSGGDQTAWERVTLQRPRLADASLTGVQWSRGQLSGKLENVEVPGLQLHRCNGKDIEIEYGTLDNVSLGRLALRGLELDYVEVRGGQFEHVTAPYSRWRNSDLQGSDLERVDLQYGRVRNCDLSSARLERCDLRDARLENCQIRGLRINGYDVEELIRKAGR